jgi:hypothetical protein
MLCEQTPTQAVIGETKKVRPESFAVEKVLLFLDAYLPEFPAIFREKNSTKQLKNENLITQELEDYFQYLTHKDSDHLFMFQFQRLNLKSPHSSDIGVKSLENYDPNRLSHAFFVIEAKCLPTRKNNKENKRREKEYVSGKYGGIQRYKKGHHGNELTDSAMVGYVQKHDCSHWHTEINGWINELIETNTATDIRWDSNDLLVFEKDFNTAQKYTSNNTRLIDTKSDPIKLHHYLLNLA